MGNNSNSCKKEKTMQAEAQKSIKIAFKRITKKEHELYRVPSYPYIVP